MPFLQWEDEQAETRARRTSQGPTADFLHELRAHGLLGANGGTTAPAVDAICSFLTLAAPAVI
jgi:hypothetical protein